MKLSGIFALILAIILVGCSSTTQFPERGEAVVDWVSQSEVPTIEPDNVALNNGQKNYNIYCAHCHGYAGEGHNPNSRQQTIDLGYATIPAHDESGHTWEHPDQLLFEAIKFGIENPLDLFIMAEYGSRLSDEEIYQVIDYLKTFWSDEQRAYQAQVTQRWNEAEAD